MGNAISQASEQQRKDHAGDYNNYPGNRFVYDDWLNRRPTRSPLTRLMVEVEGGPPYNLPYMNLYSILHGLLEYEKIYVHIPVWKNDRVRMTNFTMFFSNADGDHEIAVGKTALYRPPVAEAGVNPSDTRYIVPD